MNQSWEEKKLGEVLVKTENVDPTKKPNEEFIYLDVSAVNKETKEIENSTVLLGKDAPSRARKLVKTNDVIFATVRPTHSRVALITEQYNEQVCSTGYFVLRGKDFIYNKYLFYFLLTNEFHEQMEKLQKGASYPAVTDAEVKSIFLRFPKLVSEQKQIVSILDESFANISKAKDNAEQNLKNAKELFENYLQNVFKDKKDDWEEKPLGDVCDTGSGGTPLKSHKDYYTGGNIPWLRSGEVDKRDIIKCELYITSKGLKNSSAKLFPVDTVLIAMYGATAGQVGILRFECSTNQAVCGILPNKNFIPEFLYYKFLAGKDALVKQAVGGAQPNISQIKIRNTLVPIIPLESQKQVVKKLDELSFETKKLEGIYQQKLNDLEELKQSILQKAFNGEL